jgi:eukaryotic-like serine/threonine-protein kinase
LELREQLQQTLGDAYTLERELAGGGMSRVFVAEDTALGRKVVVKVLPHEMAAQVSIGRFKREIALAARLQHPHIVPLLAAGDSGGLPYFTMPFVEGESLRVRIAKGGELPIAEGLRILREVASALDYSHEKGIVHRDIKPDNVLLSRGSAMVTDFGVAKALSESTNAEHGGATSLGVALGTPAYMSPEQATAAPNIDARSDIYALGVLAYELFAGRPPFAGRSPQAILAAQVTEAPEQIAKLRSSLPPALAALIMRCLEKTPADRPQSAADVVHALDAITTPSGGTQPTSSVAATGARPATWLGRQRMLVGAVALVVIAAIGVMIARGRDTGPISTVAVLPFVNASGDTTYDYLAEGVSDQLRSDLTSLPSLEVKGRNSSNRFRGHDVDVHAAGTKLGVGAVVTGSVNRSGSRLHVVAELVNVARDNALWSRTFDVPATELAAVQDSIARGITGTLQVSIASARADTAAHGGSRGTTDGDAYDLYSRANHEVDRSNYSRAAVLLSAAVARDPKFARAYALLAIAYFSQAFEGVGSRDSLLALARNSVTTAVALDPTRPEVSMAQCDIQTADFQFAAADSAAARGLSANPGNRDLLKQRSATLGLRGHAAEALAISRRAYALDPLDESRAVNLQWYLYVVRDYAAALRLTRPILDLDPSRANALIAYQQLSLVYAFAGLPDSAVGAAEKALALDTTRYGGRIFAVFAYAVAGRWTQARAQRVLLARERSNSPNYQRIFVHEAFNQMDSAMVDLERAVEGKEPLVLFDNVSCNPVFDPLKKNPRFAPLMQQLSVTVCPASGRWPISPPPQGLQR